MHMTSCETMERALSIGNDEKDANRIKRIVNSIDGACGRGNSFIVKNGARNICRYHLLANANFPAWLIEHNDSERPIGIYVARCNTPGWEVHARLALSADAGRIPDGVTDVAVIRNRKLSSVMEYAKRAEDAFGLEFVIIHDESGKMDDIATLRSNEMERRDVPDVFARMVYEDEWDNRPVDGFVRFAGDVSEMERVLELYRYNALTFCRDVVASATEELGEYEHAVSLGGARVSSVMVRTLTCGHESIGLSSDEYSPNGMCAPTVSENGSYNVPYDSEDFRAFTFHDTDKLLSDVRERVETVGKLADILDIWRHVGEMYPDVRTRCMDLRMGLLNGKFSDKSVKRFAKGFTAIATEYGIDSMVDNYYDGVPLADIVA